MQQQECLQHASNETTMQQPALRLICIRLLRTAWKLVPMGFTTAAIVAEQRAELIKVTTGCKELDDILEGTPGYSAS